MITVDPFVTAVGAVLIVCIFGLGIWALGFQKRQFPKGNRTGWTPGRSGAAGWLATKFTWLSGGRG